MALEHLDTLREMKRSRPFTPFRIVTATGDEYLVEDRFQFAVTESKAMYVLPHSGALIHLSAELVVAVEAPRRRPLEKKVRWPVSEDDKVERVSALDTIRDLKGRNPFVPFQIVMNSGDRYLIENGDSLAIGRDQLHYYFPRSDRAVHMRLNQIAAVEELEEKPAA